MSQFEVKVRRIDAVEDHPDADRLSICSILGYRAITNKLPVDDFSPDNPDGVRYVHRYAPGDLIVYIPEAAVVPEHLLKQYGYWNAEKEMGMLAGKRGDRVKIIRLRGIHSQGLVWPLVAEHEYNDGPNHPPEIAYYTAFNGDGTKIANEGDDLAEFFGIEKYEPPIPAGMNGDCAGIAEFTLNYDFDSIQRWPDFFVPGELVTVTEKLHGTFTRVSFRRNVTDDRLFGPNKNIAIASKGLGAKGIVFIDTEANRLSNVYVKAVVENDLITKIEDMANSLGVDSLDIMGETFGPGIQKFSYGYSKPAFRAFDLRSEYLYADVASLAFNCSQYAIEEVPLLYSGPFSMEKIVELRDGKTTVWGTTQGKIGATTPHIREGVVVRRPGSQTPVDHNGERLRPILKAVSPAYLLKEDGTEIQ